MNAGVGTSCAAGQHPELDLDLIGDGADISPHAFADGKIGTLEIERAFENRLIALRDHGQRHTDGPALALDAELAGEFVAVAAERLDAAGREARAWKNRDVEPILALHFAIGFAGAGVDAAQIDIDRGLGTGRIRRIEAQLGAKLAEAAVHVYAHLLIDKGDFTFDGTTFKDIFTLRAPGALTAKSSLFNIEKK